MSLAAVAAGADGLLIEVHRDPEHAITDAAQQINHHAFSAMMKRVKAVAEAVGREA
jgi:3-deoxy-7-phosphoheptulonate synthase